MKRSLSITGLLVAAMLATAAAASDEPFQGIERIAQATQTPEDKKLHQKNSRGNKSQKKQSQEKQSQEKQSQKKSPQEKRSQENRSQEKKGAEGKIWKQGGAYRGSGAQVSNHKQHNLSAPPKGYRWVRDGDSFLLVATASGVIRSIATAR